MNKRKMIIIVTIVILVMIICLTLLYVINKYFNSDNYNTDFEQQKLYEPTNSIQLLNNRNKYFVIERIVSAVSSYIQEINGDMEYDTTIIDKEKAMEEFLKEGTRIVSNMLDTQYKEEIDSAEENIINIAKKYNSYNHIIDKVYVYDKSANIDIFIVYAFLGNEELNIIIKTDSENETFTIFLEDYIEKYGYSENMSIEDINIKDTNIEENEYNKFKYTNVTDELMAQYYLNNYIKMCKYNTQKAYQLLDEEYKQKRFKTYEDFIKYTQQKDDTIIKLEEYKIIKNNNYSLYICKDQYKRTYIFKEIKLMDYTVQLDDYTIKNKELIELYENMNKVDKGANSIMKFFEMINMNDYSSAYNSLNDKFKTNNFKTQQDFENYIKENTFDLNIVNIKSYGEISSTYAYNVILENAMQNDDKEYKYVINVNLLENAEFEILFEI